MIVICLAILRNFYKKCHVKLIHFFHGYNNYIQTNQRTIPNMQANNHHIEIGFSNNLINQLNNTPYIPLYFTQEQRPNYHYMVSPCNDEFVDLLDIVERGKYNSYVKDKLVQPTKKQSIFDVISSMLKVFIDDE